MMTTFPIISVAHADRFENLTSGWDSYRKGNEFGSFIAVIAIIIVCALVVAAVYMHYRKLVKSGKIEPIIKKKSKKKKSFDDYGL